MGAKAWFAAIYDRDPKEVLANKPRLDRGASLSFAQKLFPDVRFREMEDGNLVFLNPDKHELFVGVYGGLCIVAHESLGVDFPSKVDGRWYDGKLGKSCYVHATHSVVDWCAFAYWKNGVLQRALSLSSDSGIIEDVGSRLPFEEPYWNGERPVFEDGQEGEYPFPFHPLDLSEAALLAMMGFEIEGNPHLWVCDPESIPIMRFQVSAKPWWKFW